MFIFLKNLLQEEAGDQGAGGGATNDLLNSGGDNTAGAKGGQGNAGGAGDGNKGAAKFNLPDNWKEAIDEEFRLDPSLQTFKDVNALAKSYIHTKKQFGMNKVVLPTENSPESEWKEFYSKVGVPQDEKGYDEHLKLSDEDKKFLDDATLGDFKKIALKAGLTPKQAKELVGWFAGSEKSMSEKIVAQEKELIAKNTEHLKKEWGDGFDRMLGYAKQAAVEAGGQELIKYLSTLGLGNDPVILKGLAKLGQKMFKEDSVNGGNSGKGQMGFTPAEAKAELNAMYAQDKNGPFYNKNHPQHKEAVERMFFLQQAIYGQ